MVARGGRRVLPPPPASRDDESLFPHERADRLGLPPLDAGLHARLVALGRQGPDGWRTVLQILLAGPAYQTACVAAVILLLRLRTRRAEDCCPFTGNECIRGDVVPLRQLVYLRPRPERGEFAWFEDKNLRLPVNALRNLL